MTQLAAGKEVSCFCNKCQLTLAHTIVAMKDHKTPAKVVCNTCKSQHAYKTEKKAATKKITTGKKSSAKSSSIPVADLWAQQVNKAKGPSRNYNVKSLFVAGDLIEHPTFGTGIVDRVFDRTKMEVIFRDNIRTLVHGIN